MGGLIGFGAGFVVVLVIVVLFVAKFPVLFNLTGTAIRGIVVTFLAVLSFAVRRKGEEIIVKLACVSIEEIV